VRIGLFGGSFDPFHEGHISIIKGALSVVDFVIVVPSARNPFKRGTLSSPAPYRYYMTKAAVESKFSSGECAVSDIEFGISGVSYTVLTIKALSEPGYISNLLKSCGVKKKRAEEEHSLYWICGSDILPDFADWYKPEEILGMCTLLVTKREGDNTDCEKKAAEITARLGGKIEFFRCTPTPASSSAAKKTGDFSSCPDLVRDFLQTHNLYESLDSLSFCSDEACETFYDAAIGMFPLLGGKRLLHTLNVGLLAASLAQIHGGDCDKALVAGALHDCAKEMDIEVQREYAKYVAGDTFVDKKLLHSPAGAYVAKTIFGQTDSEILDAITYHTTGRGDMTLTDKLVYLSDKIEPSRTYTDLTPIRAAAQTDLDEAMRMTVSSVKDKFEKQGRDIHPLTLAMMKDLGM